MATKAAKTEIKTTVETFPAQGPKTRKQVLYDVYVWNDTDGWWDHREGFRDDHDAADHEAASLAAQGYETRLAIVVLE